MARKKAHKHSHRRIGGISGKKTGLSEIAYVAAGAIAAQLVKKFLPSTLDAKIKAAVPVVAGFVLPKIAKGNAMVKGLGLGMIAGGSIGLIQSFGVLNGIGDVSVPLIGYNPNLWADGNPPAVSGIDNTNKDLSYYATLNSGTPTTN
jgi:hypothetical protein